MYSITKITQIKIKIQVKYLSLKCKSVKSCLQTLDISWFWSTETQGFDTGCLLCA